MIIKKVTRNKKNGSLKFLTNYLEKSKQFENETRVSDRFFFNLDDNAFDLKTCAIDMQNVMNQNTRAKSSKYTHFVLSLEEKQNLSHDEWNEILKKTLKTLGLEEHQAFAVMHTDTDNQHLHLVVNNINPKTLKINVLSNDEFKLSKLRQEFNQELDLKFNKNINLNLGHSKTNSNLYELEKYQDEKTFTSYVSQLKDQLFKAQSWKEFNQILHDNGIVYKAHGNGYVFQSLDQKFATKASNINRNFSIKKLEQKFGKLEENFVPDIKPVKQYERAKTKKKKPKYIISFNEYFKTDSLFFIQSKKALESRALSRGDKIHDNGNSITSNSNPSPQTLIEMLVTMQHRVGKDKTLLIKGNPKFERDCFELARMLKINVETKNLKLQNVTGKPVAIPLSYKKEKLNELYLTETSKLISYMRKFKRIEQELESNRVHGSSEQVQPMRNMPKRSMETFENRQSTVPMSDLPRHNRKSWHRR